MLRKSLATRRKSLATRRERPAGRPEKRAMLEKKRAMRREEPAMALLDYGALGKCIFPLSEIVACLPLRPATRESILADRPSFLPDRGKSIFPFPVFLERRPERGERREQLRETLGESIFPLPLRLACL